MPENRVPGNCVIEPSATVRGPRVRGPVLVCVNPADASSCCAAAEKMGGKRHFLYNSNLWSLARGGMVCGPAVARPWRPWRLNS